MKEYLNELLNEQYAKLKQARTKEEFESINKNISQLTFYINKAKNSTDYTKLYKGICLSDINIDEKFYKFICDIIDLYANIPLLETESSIKYPALKSIQINSYDELFEFWNNIFKYELPYLDINVINKNNTIIFEKNILKKFLMFSGNCILYKDFIGNNDRMLLDRFYTIRDFVIPCSIGTQFLIKDKEAIVLQLICSSYMKAKALQALNHNQYYNEAKKLELINIDLMAYDAKVLKRNIENFELNPIIKGYILNFVYSVIGYELAHYNNINLNDILNNYSNEEHFENEQPAITAHTKKIVKKLKDSEIKK